MQKHGEAESGLGGGGNRGLCDVKVPKSNRMLSLAHQGLQDALVLPLKMESRSSRMQEKLKRTLTKTKNK